MLTHRTEADAELRVLYVADPAHRTETDAELRARVLYVADPAAPRWWHACQTAIGDDLDYIAEAMGLRRRTERL